ncbi:Uncharacterized protein conserved in archaea [Geoglobus ahangari]|uniref:Uncharacterized protein conserved in archaea n=1 Tax=Geoglobus ahangari TaxID=113653 RepID=A0A0F7IES9_9EURY|nr:hypothetical protein [Geoglobus ahangari]AKG91515.1 Uncharacterized protein conserved in archaea [Geoglobus ahangari]
MVNIDDLLILLEKSREGIQKIDEDLYIQIKRRIDELSELRKSASDEEFARVDEELRTMKRLQKRIFEMRTIKIINLAWAEVCGTESGIEGRENMIGVEREFYERLVELLMDYKKQVVEGEGIEEARPAEESDRVLLRIKQDIPEFEGVDGKTYKLRKEDVVLIPSLNANALINSGVAEKIEVKR